MKNIKKLKQELKNKKTLVQCAREFNVIGDLTRLKICYLLCHYKELSVSEIAEIVGVSISAVSHTLGKLKETKIIEGRRDSRNVYYKIKKSPLIRLIQKRISYAQV